MTTLLPPSASSRSTVDWSFWRDWPAAYHLTSLALHAANMWLVWALATRLAGPAAGLVAAAIFGLHPANHEAVYWMSARFDLLAACLALGSLLLLQGRSLRCAACALLYLAALLSKESAVAFPVVVFAYAWLIRRESLAVLLRVLGWMGGAALVYTFLRQASGLPPAGGASRLPKLLAFAVLLGLQLALAHRVRGVRRWMGPASATRRRGCFSARGARDSGCRVAAGGGLARGLRFAGIRRDPPRVARVARSLAHAAAVVDRTRWRRGRGRHDWSGQPDGLRGGPRVSRVVPGCGAAARVEHDGRPPLPVPGVGAGGDLRGADPHPSCAATRFPSALGAVLIAALGGRIGQGAIWASGMTAEAAAAIARRPGRDAGARTLPRPDAPAGARQPQSRALESLRDALGPLLVRTATRRQSTPLGRRPRRTRRCRRFT